MLISKIGDPTQNLAFGSESSFNTVVRLRPFHLSTFFASYRPVVARIHDAKLSMALTKPMDIYSPFVTLFIGVSEI